MKKYYFLNFSLFFLLLVCPLIFPEQQAVNMSIRIISHQIKEANVVGDSFYYEIFLKNIGVERINESFTISVYDPAGKLLQPQKTYVIDIGPHENFTLIPNTGRENEFLIYPFYSSGSYELEVNSSSFIDFYKWSELEYNNLRYTNYIRHTQSFDYFFDVMPRWQYDLWKSSEKTNEKLLSLNQQMVNLNVELNNATKTSETINKQLLDYTNEIRVLTIAIVVFSIITIFSQQESRRFVMDALFFIAKALLILMVILILLALITSIL